MARNLSLRETNKRMELYNLFMRVVRKMREENKQVR